jgi:hypothetical protein
MARSAMVWNGPAGGAARGRDWNCGAWIGRARHGRSGSARRGKERLGEARQAGQARRGLARIGRIGNAYFHNKGNVND